MKKKITLSGELLLLALCAILCGRDVYLRYAEFLKAGRIVPSFLLICALLLGGSLFAAALILLPGIPDALTAPLKRANFLRLPLALIVCLVPGIFYNFIHFSEPYRGLWIRVFLCGFCILLAARILEREKELEFGSLVGAALMFAAGFALTTQFHDLSSYPFSIGWSEGNRMWDYSVLFGKRLYDFPQDRTIPAYIDIGRQSLWGFIYLLPKVSILGARCWNDLLFTLPCALLGWALLKGTPSCRGSRLAAYSLWAMLFLMQGPIYTPLTLAAVLVALGSHLPLFVNCLLTSVAGFYAVMSRSTWLAAPSAFAVFLCFLKPCPDEAAKKSRWGKAVALGLSGLAGAGIYLKREVFSGLLGLGQSAVETVAETASAAESAINAVPPLFTPEWFSYYLGRQALLWDRLWPNETYAPGILGGLALAILPLLLLMIVWSIRKGWKLDGWQKLLLFAGSGIFLTAGVIFSVKIGGGSNLHNLDMFLILMLILSAIAWKAGFGEWLGDCIRKNSPLCLLLLAAVLLPVWDNVRNAAPHVFPNEAVTADAVDKIRESIEAHPGEEILFSDQRQLLTFGTVQKIPLIADYEKKWMMDEAMANNADYFEPYYRDLKDHRFAAIISEPLQIKYQGAGGDFSEENDLFVTYVSVPTLCYYEPLETFPDQGVQILVPRESVLDQEGIQCP